MTLVPANDFSAQWSEIRSDALRALDRVGKSGWLVLGQEVEQFELEVAAWWGVRHAVGVASGMDALEIALRCAGIGPGDRVLTTPLTAFATTLAILRAGAEPVWIDTDLTGGIDLELAPEALESDPSIRAVLPVHLYGHPLDLDLLRSLAHRHDVALIEDCAQSAGATRDASKTGTAGLLAATSLYPTKNLGAYGDGGLVLTEDSRLAEQAKILRNYGQQNRNEHVALGLNSRLDELQAAILRSALLPRLNSWLNRRAAVAARYEAGLADSGLRLIRPSGGRSANHLFSVEVVDGDPELVRRHLAENGIGVGRHYPVLCPEQPACAGVGIRIGDLANAHRIAEHQLSLPIHPQLDDSAVDRVIEACLTAPLRS